MPDFGFKAKPGVPACDEAADDSMPDFGFKAKRSALPDGQSADDSMPDFGFKAKPERSRAAEAPYDSMPDFGFKAKPDAVSCEPVSDDSMPDFGFKAKHPSAQPGTHAMIACLILDSRQNRGLLTSQYDLPLFAEEGAIVCEVEGGGLIAGGVMWRA